MAMKILVRSLIVGACLLAVGCTTNVSRFQMPGTDLTSVRTLHIDPPDDERNGVELRSLIDANLKQRGYQFATKDSSTVFGEGDYVFDLAADWHWDITWYLVELRVAIYDPANNTLIAQAQSQQSSMARKSIETVVDRAMASLFDDPAESDGEK